MVVQLRDHDGNLLGRKNRRPFCCQEAQADIYLAEGRIASDTPDPSYDRCDLCGCCLACQIIVHPDGSESMQSCYGGHEHQWIVRVGEPRAIEIFKGKTK